MRQLSGLDAAFVYLETHRTPMHIGGVYLIDRRGAGDDFGYDRFRAHVEQRLHLARTFRQRLIEVPFDLGHPFWIEDPDFDLDLHLPHYGVPAPADKQALDQLAAKLFSRPLNRSRPLWELAFVDGIDNHPVLAPGSFAVVGRVHHAAVDGLSGAEIMGATLDSMPEGRKISPAPPWRPEKVPSAVQMVARTYGKLGGKSVDLARVLAGAAGGAGKLVNEAMRQRLKPPSLPMSAPRTLFNAPVSPRRSFGGIEIDLDRIKALRVVVPGATVNDVLLSLCGGALRTHLLQRDALPQAPLVAMVPISVRGVEQQGDMGNQVSAMLVSIGTDLADPRHRLARVHHNAVGAKGYSKALPAHRLMDFVPSETAALAGRLYTRMKVSDRHRPLFNLVITNVPGPPIPLYLAGARVSSHIGQAPVFDGVGLILVIFSLAGKITIGITACGDMLSETVGLEQALLAELEALEAAFAEHGTLEATAAAPAPASRGESLIADLESATDRLEARLAELTAASDPISDPMSDPVSEDTHVDGRQPDEGPRRRR